MSIFKKLLQLTALAAISLTVLLLLGRFHWFLEMLTHFRLPFAGGLILILIPLFIIKSWKTSGSITICLLLQLIPLSHHYLPFTKDSRKGSGPKLEIVSFNVLTGNSHKKKVLTFLESTHADLICLQEVNTEWLETLQPLETKYPHSVAYPRDDNFGLLVLSRHPISGHHLESRELGTPYLTTEISWQGTNLTLINTHPIPPMRKENAASNKATLKRIHLDATRTRGPLVIAGDFNNSAYSPSFAPLKKSLHDTARGRGYAATWRRGHPLLGIPIDHILHNKDLICRDRRIGPNLGSDHSPIIATLQFAEE